MIVPVYKVEPYLDRCVQSIVDQTYTNLEIILVDDGSPDRCPQMCDKWASLDKRVTVIHQNNRGSGEARNRALNIASGDFIAFVDSDDYIAPTAYEFLHGLFQDNIDIVECGFCTANDDHAELDDIASPFEKREFTTEEAVKENIRDQVFRQLIWNKLYRKSTVGDIRFPIGTIIDDEFWTYQVLANAKKLVYTNKKMYAYRQQGDSVMHVISNEKRLQALEAKVQRHEYICKRMPGLKAESLRNLWFSCLYHGQLALKGLTGTERKSALSYLKKIVQTYDIHLSDLNGDSIPHKLWIILARISFEDTCRLRNLLKIGL